MRIRRGPLFWGLFFLPLGALPLLVRAGAVDPASLTQVWRLWPLALVGLGVALLLGRRHAGALGTALAAIVLGVAGGSALAAGNIWIAAATGCGDGREPSQSTEASGTFVSPATLAFDIRCGSIDLRTESGADWRVDARYGEIAPTINDGPDRLSVAVPGEGTIGRQKWSIVAPSDSIQNIDLQANAATADLRLGGASLASLTATVNAADLRIDSGEGRLASLDITMNAGAARVTLGSGNTRGAISINAGGVDLCVPREATLRLIVNDQLTFAHNLRDRGLTQSGSTWTRSGTGGDTIELRIEGNAASLTLDPDGGCR